ncbi:MAG: hypothetical protein ABIS18_05705 [Actinomycetota bacterium]
MIKVGESAVPFVLPDETRMPWSLSEALSRHPAVVLVFYLFDFSGT